MTNRTASLLIATATKVFDTIPPSDDHTVSAATISSTGQMFTGVNVRHFTGGPCAEITAIGAAATAGIKDLTHIVAIGDKDRGVLNPCGRCRQMLADYYPEMKVVVTGPEGLQIESVTDLLPFRYSRRD